MGLINQEVFICLDCETTGLEPQTDQVIEVAATKFTFDKTIDTFESLIDPGMLIPEPSQEIHHISNEMVAGKPKIQEILPALLQFVGNHIVIGHGIKLDLTFLDTAAKRNNIPSRLSSLPTIDTLRLARLYGESPINSLEKLREHFNIASEGAHRAMSDVTVNIEVFKFLACRFKTTEQVLQRLTKPILLRKMPLGKHKGRPFNEIPIEYLQWASNKDFDQDLIFSIRSELKKRKQGNQFKQASNPFSSL